jgi:hypothetical protein
VPSHRSTESPSGIQYAGGSGGGRGTIEVHHLPTQWQPSHVRPRLPVGAGIVAIGIAVLGVVILIAGTLFVLNYYNPGLVPSGLLIVRALDPIGAAILVILGAILMGLASALWDQEAWALYTTVLAVFIMLAYEFFTGSITFLFLVLLVLFVYLLAVRRHFY